MVTRRTNLDELIASFADTLAEAVREQVREAVVEALSAELGSGPPRSKRQPAGTKKRPARGGNTPPRSQAAKTRRRIRRSAADIEQQRSSVLDLLHAQPDLRAEQIGRAVGIESKSLAPLLRGLTDDGLLTRTGVARGTRYQPAATRRGRAPLTADTSSVAAKDAAPKRSPPKKAKPSNKVSKTRAGETKATATRKARSSLTPKAARAADGAPKAPTPTQPAATASVEPTDPKLRDEALRWVRNNPGDTSTIIGEALQVSSSAARAVLKPLVDEGLLERQGDGRHATYAAS